MQNNKATYLRVKETPSYSVQRVKQAEIPEGRYKLLHIGLYLSNKYGLTPYADIEIVQNKRPVRFNLGKSKIDIIDQDSHNDSIMRDIHDGLYEIEIKRKTISKDGNIKTFLITKYRKV